MLPVELSPSIYWVGVNDRRTDLFENLWPILSEGISYNSYLIVDEKKALIDMSSKATVDDLLDQIKTLVAPAELDYVIVNHMEPDHTGALKILMALAPKAKILGTEKTRKMLETFYGLSDRLQVVCDGDELCLGEHTLRFVATPFVHWPETMMTYEINEKILFSCDGFGGYGALNGCIFDEPFQPLTWYEEQALRYYVNIVATFSKPVRNAIGKLSEVPLAMVAPSHGLIWRNHPERIIKLYQRWAAYANGPGDAGVTLMYASMYGNTQKMMEAVAQGVGDAGLPLYVFDVARAPMSIILPSLWLHRGVLVGAPTYEGCLFPDMIQALEIAKIKHISNRLAGGFGSCGWAGGGQSYFKQTAAALKWEIFDSIEFMGEPKINDLHKGRTFGTAFALKVKETARDLSV